MGVSGTVGRQTSPTRLQTVVPSDIEHMAYGLLGSPQDIRDELDRIQGHVNLLYTMEPDLAMRVISAYSTRLTEIARLLFRVEVIDRQWIKIRTMDCLPLLEELDRQFKLHSRMLEARAQDLSMEGIRR